MEQDDPSAIPADWTFIGYREVCDDCEHEYPVGADDEQDADPGFASVDSSDPESGTATQSRKMHAFNAQTGEMYEIELSAEMMDSLAEAAKETGSWFPDDDLDAPSLAGAPNTPDGPESYGFSAETPTLPGWSNGVDTRERRTDVGAGAYRAMGQINGGMTSGCSGTMVGSRLVATAAHCIWNRTTDAPFPFTFRPGRSGTCSTWVCQIFGAHGATWYMVPSEYRVPGQDQAYYNDHDWGFVVTQTRPGDTTGWLGMAAYTQSDLQNRCNSLFGGCFNRGYPACGFAENSNTPDGCTQGFPYASVERCLVGSYHGGYGPDGWRSRFKTGCDMGRGHSGSAVWHVVSGAPSNAAVVGVASTQDCALCGPGINYPNGMRRVTPDVTAWYIYFLNHPQFG